MSGRVTDEDGDPVDPRYVTECPECHRHSLIQYTKYEYCTNCNYEQGYS